MLAVNRHPAASPATDPGAARHLRLVPDPAQVLVGQRLYRYFPDAAEKPFMICDVSLAVRRGESVAVIGAAGAGKTILLSLLAGLDEPDNGTVFAAGQQMSRRSEAHRARLRANHIGVLCSPANLLDHLTVAQNIVFARHLAGRRGYRDLSDRLAAVDLTGLGDSVPAALAAGQLARAGLAVALANDPPLLIADEPCAGLDAPDESRLLDLLRTQADRGTAVLLATRSEQAAQWCDRTVRLVDGQLV